MNALKKYLITLLVGFLAVAGIIWGKDIFEQTAAVSVFHILCDAFFVVGTVMTSFGLLVFTTNEGSFDGLVYGVTCFLDMFRGNHKKKYHTFYDYKQSRADKKFEFGFLLICGLFFLAISFVMYFFYRKYS